jgi:predicted alpha/beta-hydrolase family hydrolase
VTKAKALLLAPGAGADRDHHTLVALEEAVAPMPVVRMDFPYRKAGRKAPDRAPVLEAAVRDELDALVADRRIRPRKAVVMGGRSMGGRICSMVVAAGTPAAGLVLISYPLHPPGKPDRLRTEHLPYLDVPVLFISGTRDPFGSPDELESATAVIPGPVTHHWIEGGRHDLKGSDPEICEVATSWLAAL